MTAPLADAVARDRIATDLATTLVVEAAAGTGKTTALVSRIVALAGSGATELRRVVAVTFTEKAAGEMKLRLRAAIEEARKGAEAAERAALDQALEQLEAARIGTIHSLCRDLLGERPVEAGIDPMFEVAAEAESGALFDAAFERWFQATLADPPEGVRRLLRRPVSRNSSPRSLLRTIGLGLKERRDFPGPWRRDPFDREVRISEVLRAFDELGAHLDAARDPDDYLARNLAKVRRWTDEQHRAEEVRDRDFDGLEAALRSVARWREWNYKGSDRKFGSGRAEVLERRDEVKALLDDVVAACDADLAPLLDAELRPLVAAYEQLKSRAGKLDFLDLLSKTRDLLVAHAGVRQELQRRFSHLLVDEFQDTDPLQAEIVLLLASADPTISDPTAVVVKPGKLFLVGDPKQSIYSFRRADIAIYEGVKQRLLAQGAELLKLSVSFRSDPRIQAAVNAAFAPRMRGDGQARYVALEPFRAPSPDVPAVVALPVPAPYAHYGKMTNRSVDESLPWAVGAWIDWLVNDSGRTVEDPVTREQVPVEARHICLLFRRFQSWGRSVTTPYTRELETRAIPHVLVGGRSFHDREETMVLRNALAAIEWPDDELAVFATLKGPLFAVPDDALLAYKSHFAGRKLATLNPLRNVDDEVMPAETADAAEALAVLRRLHLRRNRRPIAETITELLEITRAHAGFAIWNAGEQVLANVLRVTDVARRFESGGTTSFRAFVEHLTAEAERGEAPQAPVVEEGTEGVRVMTVHKAKGLEFPVVVLCDITARATSRDPQRLVVPETRTWYATLAGCVPTELAEAREEVLQREAEESDRLLYVAATRARDLLVVPAVGDEPQAGWVDALTPSLYPAPKNRRRKVAAPGCPQFGDDTVSHRPDRAPSPAAGVVPGLHRSGAGTEVVWWDPDVLPRSRRAPHGLRHQKILAEDDGGTVAAQGLADHAAWGHARAERIRACSTKSIRVVTPTELAATAVAAVAKAAPGTVPPPPEPLLFTDASRDGRPTGKRIGSLIHGALEDLVHLAAAGVEPTNADVERVIDLHARLTGASPAEVTGATDAAHAALKHPLLRRAAASAECRPECEISWVNEDGVVVEGTGDLLFREDTDDGALWTVVEFKSSLETDEAKAKARIQLETYSSAVHAATGDAVEGFVLIV